MNQTPVTDIHTHTDRGPGALLCVDPSVSDSLPDVPYAAGVHPWRADMYAEASGDLERMASAPGCLAVGETGLDRRRGPSLDCQIQAMRNHVALSERIGKPLILHCVGCTAELLALHRELHPRQPWIIHGFRGKPQLARQLLDRGLYLSLGSRFNPATARIIPDDHLLIETDNDPSADISQVAAAIAPIRETTPEAILSLTASNTARLL